MADSSPVGRRNETVPFVEENDWTRSARPNLACAWCSFLLLERERVARASTKPSVGLLVAPQGLRLRAGDNLNPVQKEGS